VLVFIFIVSLSSKKSSIHSVDSRIRLANTLGFIEYPANPSIEPYLDYILKQDAGNATTEEYVELFIEMVEHFRLGALANSTATVQILLDNYSSSGFRNIFADTTAGDPRRKEHVEDTVMRICRTWNTMLSSFQYKGRAKISPWNSCASLSN
jgi:hypothetical protein